jgi:tetratricopeptide (TPR) repeat protein
MSLDEAGLLKDVTFAPLVQRVFLGRCALFLGAGASKSSGAPTTPELAQFLAREVLQAELEGYSLGDVVDYIDGTTGRKSVTEAIGSRLGNLTPSASLRSLCLLPWRAIYTVNFDDLVEQSFALDRPGELEVFTSAKDIEKRDPNLTPLIMLHGSIKDPLSKTMGLVLTQDDFNRSVSQRRSMYHALTDDMTLGEVVYLGFAMADPDFRKVVDDLHAAVDGRQELLPRGYAIMPNPPAFAENFWQTKKISMISSTLEAFVGAAGQVRSGRAAVQPIPVGTSPTMPEFLSAISPVSSEADELAWAFEFPEHDTGTPDPATFLHGGPITWPTIRERFDAPRALADDMLVQLLMSPDDEPANPAPGSTKFVLLSGPAGSGKTTIAKRAAWDLAVTWGKGVVWTRHPSRLQVDLIEILVRRGKKRVFVFIDNAADGALQVVDVIRRSRRRGIRATFVIAERLNEWTIGTREVPIEPDRVFEIGVLSDPEADGLLTTLAKAGELGTLAGLPHDEQVARLVTRAGRQLLVGLREATEDGKRFDEIIEDELRALPSDSARRAYLAVCTLFQFNVATRAGVLSRTTGVPFDRFRDLLLEPTRGVILERQSAPWEQPAFEARHRVIAEIVFHRAFRTPEDRSLQVMALLQQLDLGYREDQRAFARLTNARWLRECGIQDPSAVFALARHLRPDDPFVIQQEALSWRFREPSRARELLREAASLAPHSETIEHSQAVLLADEAKAGPVDQRNQRYAEAEKRFRKLITRDPGNSAPYVSLTDLLIERSRLSSDPQEQIRLLGEAERLLEDAFKKAPLTFQLLEAAARLDSAAGDISGAEDEYRKAADAAGPNPAVWMNLARFLDRHGKPAEAIDVLNVAIDLNPTHPGLNYTLAMISEKIPRQTDASIRRAYEYAVAEPVRGHLPELDYAIYLHRCGDTDKANEHFANLRALTIPYRVKAMPRRFIEMNGQRVTFEATVTEIRFRSAYVSVPDHDHVYIDPGSLPLDARHVGAHVSVHLAYNCFGLRAVLLGDQGDPEADEAAATEEEQT